MFKDLIVKFLKIEGLISNLTGYIETRAELLKMEVKQDVAKILSKTVVGVLLAFMLFFVLMLSSFALAFYLGHWVGDVSGFLIVSFLYVLIGLGVFLFKGDITAYIEKQLTELTKSKPK